MKALSFGEILWDLIGTKAYIGGAPFNVAAHLARMGLESGLVSAVGNDKLGHDAISEAQKFGVDTQFVGINKDLSTGTVDVLLKNSVPSFTINENVAWDNIIVSRDMLQKISSETYGIFCFGTLAQRSAKNSQNLNNLINAIKACHIFYDVNLRQNYFSKEIIEYSLKKCTVVKLNDDEAKVLSKMLFGKDYSLEEFSRILCSQYKIGISIITKGPEGAVIFDGSEMLNVPAVKVEAIDTVGAGDAFSAAFLFAYSSGKDVLSSAKFAMQMGAFVATKKGSIPDYDEKITEALRKIQPL